MHQNVALISTLAAGLGLALVMGFISVRLKLPALVGYLVAGMIVGPFTPGFVADVVLTSQLAEVGVILLMFGVGLHLSITDLLSVKRIAVSGALAQMVVAIGLGAALGVWWGWSLMSGVIFGLSLSVASTVVLLKTLESRGLMDSVNGHIAVGWLVIQDLVMVLVLVLLPPLAAFNQQAELTEVHSNQDIIITLLVTLGKVILFIALMLSIGRRFFPWLLWQVASTGTRELFTLCIVVAAIGIAYMSLVLFGVSLALGAFFAGVVLRESDLSYRAAEESLPLRDAFSVLFFVSVGMLFNPQIIVNQPLQLMAVLAVIIIGKSLAAFFLVLAFRYPLNTALTVTVGLAQIGEFSFILVALAVSLNLLSVDAQSLVLAAAMISIALNPLIFYTIEPIQKWIRARSALARILEKSDDPLAELPMSVASDVVTNHVVLVGYGRVGRRIAEALRPQKISVVIAEENREIVEMLRAQNIHAVAGNASEAAVLIQAHIARAKMLIIAIPDTFHVRQMVDIARTLNPRIDIVVRTHTEEDSVLFQQENVGKVFMGEHELATAMIDYIMSKNS